MRPAAATVTSEPAAPGGAPARDEHAPMRQGDRRAILFIRSVALPLALRALAALRQSEPGAHIVVLTNTATARAVEERGLADEIVIYAPARYGIAAAGVRRIADLRRRRFDLIAVPHAGLSWQPFWNVGRLALTLGGRDTRWLPAEGPAGSAWAPVSVAGWATAVRPSRRARLALLACLKWPLLIGATAAALAALLLTAPVLFLLVWIAPAPEDRRAS